MNDTKKQQSVEPEVGKDLGGQISLMDLWLIFRERWLIGLAVGLLVSTLVLFNFLRQTKTYQAQSTILVKERADRVVAIESVDDTDLGVGRQQDIELNNHLSRLRSAGFIDQLVGALDETHSEWLARAYVDDSEDELERSELIRTLLEDNLRFERLRNTQILGIDFIHRDPRLAAKIPNMVAEQYVLFNLTRSGGSTKTALDFLEKEVASQRDEVRAKELAYQEFRLKHGLAAEDENQDVVAERLKAISSRKSASELLLADYNSQFAQVELVRSGRGNLLEIPFIAEYGTVPTLVQEMEALLGQRGRLEIKYFEKHPDMISNENAIRGLQQVLDQNVTLAIADLETKIREQEGLITSLESKMEEAESDKVDLGGVMNELVAFRTDVAEERSLLEDLLGRYNQLKVSGRLNSTNIEFLDRARTPERPHTPNRKLAALASMASFGMLFLGVPLVIGLFDNKLKRVGDLENFLGAECAGCVPMLDNKEIPPEMMPLAVYKDLDESLTESFRGIYSFMELTSQVPFPKRLLVTSTCPSEGKSFVSTSLSCLFGKHGKRVVIIDCDFRKPTQHKNFGAKNDFGTIRWYKSGKPIDSRGVLGDEELGIRQIGDTNVHLLAAGGSSKSPSEMASSPRFLELMEALSVEFDLVLVDTPPVGLFPDALFFADYVDEILFVSKHNHLPRHQVKAAFMKFSKSQARVVGVVFNQMKQGSMAGYGYGNYGYGSYSNKYYQKYYSEEG